MARRLFEVSGVRRRNGQLATGVLYAVYSDAAGTTLADISATVGGGAISGSTVTVADIAGLGPSALRFYGPSDATDTLWLKSTTDASLGVQKIEASTDERLDDLEAGGGGAHPDLATHDALGLATDAELATHAADGTSIHGITDTAQLSVRELLSQAVIDAYEGRTLTLRNGTHTVATALNLHPDSSYVGDSRDGTLIQGTAGQDIFLLPSSALTDYSYTSIRDMSFSGGRRQLSSLRLFTYFDMQRVTLSGPSAECVYMEGRVEEWYFDNVRMEGGTHGFRLAHVLADGLNYIDKSTLKDVTAFQQTVNGIRLEADGAVGNVTFINPWIALSGQHGFYMDGGHRATTFINPNTEGNGQSDSAVIRTTGSMTAASAVLTVPVATIANGRNICVRGAGANGVDLQTTVSSGGGTTSLTLAAAASTSVTSKTVTTAIYDDFHFDVSIVAPAQIQFLGGGLGLETSGNLRYSIYNPGVEMLILGTKSTGNVPIYDGLGKTRAIGGAGPIIQYGVEQELGNGVVIHPYHANDVGFIVRGQPSQSVAVQEWQSHNGTVGLSVDASQKLKFPTAQQAATATAGAATLPANPVGFFIVKDASGTDRKIPYYAT